MLRMIHRLAELLKDRGAKKRLADALNKPPSIISDLCAGKDRLNDDLIRDISAALNIPPWQLFVNPRDVVPQEYRALMDDYRRLGPDDRRIVDAIFTAARLTDNGAPKKAKA